MPYLFTSRRLEETETDAVEKILTQTFNINDKNACMLYITRLLHVIHGVAEKNKKIIEMLTS